MKLLILVVLPILALSSFSSMAIDSETVDISNCDDDFFKLINHSKMYTLDGQILSRKNSIDQVCDHNRVDVKQAWRDDKQYIVKTNCSNFVVKNGKAKELHCPGDTQQVNLKYSTSKLPSIEFIKGAPIFSFYCFKYEPFETLVSLSFCSPNIMRATEQDQTSMISEFLEKNLEIEIKTNPNLSVNDVLENHDSFAEKIGSELDDLKKISKRVIDLIVAKGQSLERRYEVMNIVGAFIQYSEPQIDMTKVLWEIGNHEIFSQLDEELKGALIRRLSYNCSVAIKSWSKSEHMNFCKNQFYSKYQNLTNPLQNKNMADSLNLLITTQQKNKLSKYLREILSIDTGDEKLRFSNELRIKIGGLRWRLKKEINEKYFPSSYN